MAFTPKLLTPVGQSLSDVGKDIPSDNYGVDALIQERNNRLLNYGTKPSSGLGKIMSGGAPAIIGGIIGSLTPAGPAGAAIGAAIGQTVSGITKDIRQGTKTPVIEAAKQIGTQALFAGGADILTMGAGKLLGKAGKFVKSKFGKIIQKGENVVAGARSYNIEAARETPELVQQYSKLGAREGTERVVQTAKGAATEYRAAISREFGEGLEQIKIANPNLRLYPNVKQGRRLQEVLNTDFTSKVGENYGRALNEAKQAIVDFLSKPGGVSLDEYRDFKRTFFENYHLPVTNDTRLYLSNYNKMVDILDDLEGIPDDLTALNRAYREGVTKAGQLETMFDPSEMAKVPGRAEATVRSLGGGAEMGRKQTVQTLLDEVQQKTGIPLADEVRAYTAATKLSSEGMGAIRSPLRAAADVAEKSVIRAEMGFAKNNKVASGALSAIKTLFRGLSDAELMTVLNLMKEDLDKKK